MFKKGDRVEADFEATKFEAAHTAQGTIKHTPDEVGSDCYWVEWDDGIGGYYTPERLRAIPDKEVS